jgi:demethylmenaquinone methyltransferase / 2-methoxy-6-polyprenyl-1,4-benzoquinol methylase
LDERTKSVSDDERSLIPPAEVQGLFDQLAPRYDLLNHLFSMGQDLWWRYRAAKTVTPAVPGPLFDGATGTGDLAIALAKHFPDRDVVGADFSEGMLVHGRRKIVGTPVEKRIEMRQGDLTKLDFDDDTFAGATVAFGIRNVGNRPAALSELARVIKPGGKVVILEFAMPTAPVFTQFYKWYFGNVMPMVAGWFNAGAAFGYLFDSVQAFPSKENFLEMMRTAGFSQPTAPTLSLGTVVVYNAVVPEPV